MKIYPYVIIRNSKKIKSGAQKAYTMEDALDMVKNRFKITREDTGTTTCNHFEGKPVSIAIFEEI
jgi:hypothetical protein